MKTTLIFLIIFLVPIALFSQTELSIVKDDNTICLTTYGEGDPMLIINGGPGMSSEGFRALAEIMGQSHKAIIYDQRGTGKSKISRIDTSTITMDAMIRDIEMIRNHLEIDEWIVFGHSFGGMLASYYASKFQERVKGLILSSSGGINMELFSIININVRLTSLERDSLNYWNAKIANGDTTYFARLQRGRFLAPAYLYDKSNVPIVANRLTQGNLTINRLVFQNMRKIDFDCSEALKDFKAPVLIIQGQEDIIDKSIAETAHGVFRNSTVTILEKCGHYGWLDQPERYFGAIENFLQEVE